MNEFKGQCSRTRIHPFENRVACPSSSPYYCIPFPCSQLTHSSTDIAQACVCVCVCSLEAVHPPTTHHPSTHRNPRHGLPFIHQPTMSSKPLRVAVVGGGEGRLARLSYTAMMRASVRVHRAGTRLFSTDWSVPPPLAALHPRPRRHRRTLARRRDPPRDKQGRQPRADRVRAGCEWRSSLLEGRGSHTPPSMGGGQGNLLTL